MHTKDCQRRTNRLLGWCAVLALVMALAAPIAAGASALPLPPSAPTPEAAAGLALAAYGNIFAGECTATRSPEDIGKLCSKFVARCGNVRAYVAGRTFSEFSLWVFVRQTPDGWYPAGTLPLDQSATSLTVPWPIRCAAT